MDKYIKSVTIGISGAVFIILLMPLLALATIAAGLLGRIEIKEV